jgi:hypothetical protein
VAIGEWGTYEKKTITVDEKTLTMKINKQVVAQVSTQSGSLQVEWLGEEWTTAMGASVVNF